MNRLSVKCTGLKVHHPIYPFLIYKQTATVDSYHFGFNLKVN